MTISQLPDAIKPRHVAIAEFLVLHPRATRAEIASHFDVTPACVSTIMRTDAFQDLLRRKQDAAFAHMIEPLAEKLNSLGHEVIDRLLEKVITMNTGELLESGKFVVGSIDFTGKAKAQSGAVGVNVYQSVVTQDLLQEARQRVMRRSMSANGETIDVVAAEVVSAGGGAS